MSETANNLGIRTRRNLSPDIVESIEFDTLRSWRRRLQPS